MLKTLQSNMSVVWAGERAQWPAQATLGVGCRRRPRRTSCADIRYHLLFHNVYTMKTLQRRRAKTMRPEVNRSETLYIGCIVSKSGAN
jgi:hypothetical protein